MKLEVSSIFIAFIANFVFTDGIKQNFLELTNDKSDGRDDTIRLKKDSNVLTFGKTYYTATYTAVKNQKHSLTAEDITINDSAANITLIGDEAFHFGFNCELTVCTLIIERDLPAEILKNTSEIILGIQATKKEVAESAFAFLTINLPLKNVKPAPKFSQSYYIYKYQIDEDGTPSLTSEGDPIDLVEKNEDTALVEITLSNYQPNFAVSYDTSASQWNIEVKEALDEEILKENKEILTSLTGILDGAADNGTATLLIKFFDKDSTKLSFGKPYYKAAYTVKEDENDAIDTDEDITIISDKELDFKLIGDDAFHFKIDCESGTCQLSVKQNIPNSILKSNTEIVITLEASTPDNTAYASTLIIISLQSKNINSTPKFTQTYYIYKYQIDDKGEYSLTPDGNPVDVESDDKASVTITLSDYQDNFAFTYDSDSEKWDAKINEILEDSILSENTELIISLTDVLDDSDQNTATLIIELPGKAAADVTFDKNFYEATYTVVPNAIDSIQLDKAIQITNNKATVILSGDFSQHFSVNCTDGSCKLNVTDNLSDYLLTSKKQIIINLEASTEESAEPSIALILVHLPSDSLKPAPKFSQIYYIYKYQIDSEILLPDGDPLSIASENSASVTVTLSDYNDNFKVTYDSDQWNIRVQNSLEESVIKDNTELVVSVTAELDGSEKSTATVLIKLPEQKSDNITFDKAYYKATYIVKSSEEHTITNEETMTISDKEATVTLIGDYAAHFNINCSTGTCHLSVKDNLAENILSNNKEIILGLEISKEDITEPVTNFVLITLPSGNIKPGPQFSHSYYIYEYQVDGEEASLNPDGDALSFTSINSSVKVTLSDYESNFLFTCDANSDQCKSEVTELLDKTVLKENTELVVTLTGQLDDSEKSTATLLIKLPEKSSVDAHFEESHYRASYITKEGQLDVITTEEDIIISDNKATVSVTGDYSTHFSINCSTSPCQLSVTDNLSEDILSSTKEIILGLQITEDDITEPVTSYVLVTLPLGNIKLAPNFSRSYYIYEYQVDGEKTSLIPNGDPIAFTSDSASVKVNLSDYDNNFSLKYDNEAGQWKIDVDEALEEAVFEENSELIISLTAEFEDSEKSTATLLIKLPKGNSEDATFDKDFYKAVYTVRAGHLDQITTEEKISFGDNKATVTLTGEYATHFSIDCSTGTCQLNVTDNLSKYILSGTKEIVLGLKVTRGLIVEPVTSFILVTLPSGNIKLGPQFSHTYYVYEYQIDEKSISLNADGDPIAFITDSTSVKVTLSDYQSNFNVTYDSDAAQWKIDVLKDLNDTVLEENNELVISLTAILDDSEKTTATLIIILPEKTSQDVTFNKSFYTATYKVIDGELDTLTFDEEIIVTDDEAKVTITGDYASHFDVKCSAGKCNVTVKEDFAEDILAKTYDTIIQLEASNEDTDEPVTAVIIISLPLENAKPAPKFSHIYYIYDYQIDDEEKPILILNGDPISITSDDGSEVNVTIDDYKDNFALFYDKESSQWNILINESLDDDILRENTELIVTLTGSVEDSDKVGTATLIINLPESSTATLSFDKSFYRATYTTIEDATDSITNEEITISDNEAEVTITGMDAYNFDIECIDGKCKLSVKENLPESILTNDTILVIGLEATTEDLIQPVTAVVVIALPLQTMKKSLEFTQTYYTYEYHVDDEGIPSLIANGDPLAIINDNDKPVSVVLSDYEDSFELTYDVVSKQVTMSVQQALDVDILKENNELLISVTATVRESEEEDTAALLIKLPEKKSANVTFGKPYYKATYTAVPDGIDSVNVEEDITINIDEATVTITGDYPFNFAAKCDSGKCALSLTEDLSDDILAKKSQIIIVLDAVATDAVEHDKTLVLIDIEAQASPEFNQAFYEATYTIENGKPDLITNGEDIIIDDSDATVTVNGDYATHFAVDCDTYGKCQLSVIEDLPESILENNTEIVIELQATTSVAIEPSIAVVIISLPLKNMKPAPKFAQLLYTADYETDGPSLILTSGDQIAVISDYEELVIVKLANYEDIFQPIYDYDTKQWNIIVKQPLNESVLQENTELVLQLTAILENSVDKGTAILLINLPSKESSSVTFNHVYYKFNYTIDDDTVDAIIGDNITVSDTSAIVSVTGDFSSYFAIELGANGVCQLKVTKDLPHDILSSNTEIAVILEASKNDTNQKTTALVIVYLPVEDSNKIPEFSQMIYSAIYTIEENANDSVNIINGSIKITNVEDQSQITITLEGDYKDSFQPVLRDDHWELSVTEDLLPAVINDEISITLSLKAKLKSVAGEGVSVLVVQLPKKMASMRFTSNVYMADYNSDSSDKIETENDIIIMGDNAGEATVMLTGAYEKYFASSYGDSKVTVTLSKNFSNKIVKNTTALSVNIEAIKGMEKVTATLVVKFPKNNDSIWDNSRALIISVAALSIVLLIALIVTVVLCRNNCKKKKVSNRNYSRPTGF